MIEIGDLPTVGVVTIAARGIGQHMRRTLAGRDVSVMTQLAWIDHCSMAEARHGPVIGGMADITSRAGRDVVARFAAGGIAVMASLAWVGHP